MVRKRLGADLFTKEFLKKCSTLVAKLILNLIIRITCSLGQTNWLIEAKFTTYCGKTARSNKNFNLFFMKKVAVCLMLKCEKLYP